MLIVGLKCNKNIYSIQIISIYNNQATVHAVKAFILVKN